MVAVEPTHVVGTVASIALAVVLVTAGVTKLAGAWREDSRALGVPWPVAAPVPYVEIVLGALLATGLGRPLAAWGAAALMVLFTGLVALHLAHGRRPPCACFGAWSRKPLGAGHLVRNVVFAVLAVLAVLA